MALSWNDWTAIAQALAAHHPDADVIGIDGEALRRLVTALPEFGDAPWPSDPHAIAGIHEEWVIFTEGGPDGDGPLDAYS